MDDDVRVLVTGGGRGIGRAIALRFAREGASVVVAARSSGELDDVVAEIEGAGGRGLAAQMNVTDHGSVEAAVYRAVNFLEGRVDVLVNNAGTIEIVPFADMTPQIWTRQVEVNLTGAFYTTLEALDALEESGRAHVFNVASLAARQAYPGNTAYCASKAGLRGFGDALRVDLAEQGIRVTTVYPGTTRTAMLEKVPDADPASAHDPEDVAEVIFAAYVSDEPPDDLEVAPRG